MDQCSEEFHDQGSADFLMEKYEEMAWMLRSFIEGEALEPNGQKQSAETKVPVGV